MKILYISNSRIPTEKAYGVQIMKTCEALAGAGINLELILPTRKSKDFKNVDPFEYYGVERNFKIRYLSCFDPDFLINLGQGIYIKIQLLFFVASLFFNLIFKSKEHEYIFYTRDEYLLKLLHRFSKKVVWESHGLPKNKKRYLNAWQKCYKIVCLTQGLKDELVSLGVEEGKICVVPDGVDLDKFQVINDKKQIREKLDLPTDKKIVMYTGHLYDWKGVQVLADAAKLLGDDSLVVFVGGTEFDLNNFKEKNKGNHKILLLGQKPYKDIPFYLKSADCLVLPNTAEDEKSVKWTSPLKMFEYMASDVPIVASSLPSLREILNDKNAFLVAADDPQELAGAISNALQNREKYSKLAKQALVDVKQYSWQKRADKIINFLK